MYKSATHRRCHNAQKLVQKILTSFSAGISSPLITGENQAPPIRGVDAPALKEVRIFCTSFCALWHRLLRRTLVHFEYEAANREATIISFIFRYSSKQKFILPERNFAAYFIT